MSKEERFEIFNEDGKWVIKDNEQLPHLLDLYKSCVRLNEFVDKIADLEAKLAEKDKTIESQHNGIGYWKSVAEKRPDVDYVFKIKDLESQLAESENCACKHIGELTKIATEKDRKIEELKQQLAEEKEFTEQYRKECAKIQSENVQLKPQIAELDSELAENVRENECLKEQLAEKDADILAFDTENYSFII